MNERKDTRPPAWSYTSSDLWFEPIKSKRHNPTTNPVYSGLQVYRIQAGNIERCMQHRPPRPSLITASITSSTSSYALSTWPNKGDREAKRKKRVAAYKALAVESKVKVSIRNSFQWMKNKYSAIVHGY